MNVTDRLDEIEARANAATDGPWRARRWDYFCEVDYNIETSAPSCVADLSDPDDADFIAHAREDVPALVAALRAVLDLARREYESDDAERLRDAITSALGGA
jgi:hypothetical protein